MEYLSEFLEVRPACKSSKRWVEENRFETLDEAIEKLDRADWLMWLAIDLQVDQKLIMYTLLQCAKITPFKNEDLKKLVEKLNEIFTLEFSRSKNHFPGEMINKLGDQIVFNKILVANYNELRVVEALAEHSIYYSNRNHYSSVLSYMAEIILGPEVNGEKVDYEARDKERSVIHRQLVKIVMDTIGTDIMLRYEYALCNNGDIKETWAYENNNDE